MGCKTDGVMPGQMWIVGITSVVGATFHYIIPGRNHVHVVSWKILDLFLSDLSIPQQWCYNGLRQLSYLKTAGVRCKLSTKLNGKSTFTFSGDHSKHAI